MAGKARRQTSLEARRVVRSGRMPPASQLTGAVARTEFPIAVVGASAGGLEAFRRLLSALPAESGMGFILVPHLDPKRQSHMVEILAPASAMPVNKAVDGKRIQRNHVYVIPPNRLLAVRAGRFELTPLPEPGAGRTALDLALRSLAEDQGANAVGIVLSGTGSHGATGLKEILRAGGLGLAQDPLTAQYDQMPRSAAAAGVRPQYVLTPEDMAPVLLEHARQHSRNETGFPSRPPLATQLFREAGALDLLTAEALPSLVARTTEEHPLRVWVPQCGTGDEAYSVAMLLLERLEAAGKQAFLKVFATDQSAASLRVARLGIYPESIAATVSPERLARFFIPVPIHQYQVSSELRQAMVFGLADLFTDPPISKIDLLICRAPLGTLRADEHDRLISRLHFALNPGGYLLLAPGAPAMAASALFEIVSEKESLYRKHGLQPHSRGNEGAVAAPEQSMERGHARHADPQPAPPENVAEFMDHALLGKLAPAAILMNARYRILATRGPVTKYLRIPSRMPLPSLLTAADTGLRAATQSACEQAMRNHQWVRHAGGWMRPDGRRLRCRVSARSLRRPSGERVLLVIFEDDDSADDSRALARAVRTDAARTKLQAIRTDLEHAKDDLKASNDQMSSMNEELRSANEELQSSNEEMQAVNSELESSKTELQERTEAAERVEAQLRAVLDATADAVVTISAEGKIVTFNGSASRMFGYALHEVVGRDVSMLLPPELRAFQDECLARYRNVHQVPVIGASREVVAYRRDGSRFPALLSVSETADGALLVGCLRDITADKALQEEILHIAALEQQRIGQELHDGTQQELTGLGLLAQNLSEELQESGSSNAELAKRLAAGIAEANRHVRATARGLVPVPVDARTLPAALAELVRTTQETYKQLSCRLDCPEPLKMPDAATATHLYRIAQEAVGNAAKHSKADDVLIRLARGGNRLRLEVHDNGIGIPAQPAANGGVGLRLMEHRCTAIGGRFSVEPREGGGTVVSCTVPFLGGS